MEGCPRLTAIGFDLKSSLESVNLCEKIPNFITANYQENGENFTKECDQINQLRQSAINCSVDETGIQWLKRYYCQLQLLRNRFPMYSDGGCSVRFTWEDGFQREENTYNDIRYEEACILYNIGVIYSKLGAHESRKTHESMKNACTYFRYSAACFEKVRDQYTPYSLDFTPELLTCQVEILLAQAHEAVLEKSVLDQRPPSVNAHIAKQISEYYQMALSNLEKPEVNSIISKQYREWRTVLTYKLSYYLAVTYYCCGMIAEETKKRGEAVCYFENAVERLKDGWKNAEKVSSDKTSVYKDVHAFTTNIITAKYKSMKRDNDNVYFEKVPTLSSLPVVRGAVVAKSQAFDCQNSDVCGADIFQKLVPLDIHLAASEYSEEKAKVLREIVDLTDAKSRELESFMNCLQLDRLLLNSDDLRLPRELLDCSAGVISQPNMTRDLISVMQQINSQHHDVNAQLTELEQSIEAIEKVNVFIKTNKDYKDLQMNLKNIRGMMSQANDSNIELHRHMTAIIDHLKILGSTPDQLEKSLPMMMELNDENNKSKLARLSLLNEKVETMKKQRETLVQDLRKKIEVDDITKLVLMRRQENHKSLFSDQLKKHEELINIIKQNCTAQDNILQSLSDANADIADLRANMITISESRQRLIQAYINSYKSFNDTLSKANEGIEFYKKQTIKLTSLNERLISLKSEQELSIEYDRTYQETNVSLVSDRPRLKDYLPTMKPVSWGSTANRSASKVDENTYIPSPMSHRSTNNNFYSNVIPPANSFFSNISAQTYTSLPNCNSHELQSPTHSDLTSIQYAPLPPTLTSSVCQHSMPYHRPQFHHSYSYDQNFHGQLPSMYNSSISQQQYHPNPTFQTQQTVYSSQPVSVQHQISYPPSAQTTPIRQSGLSHPSVYQYQNISDSNRSAQQSVPMLPSKFDPYRPQPVGAYDIPSHAMNPQDVYRPGGFLGMNQTQVPPSIYNNNSYGQNQFVQYIPFPPSSSSSTAPISSTFSNLSIN
ncbi:unnamed protein product [Adineta ricciae]|uniref:BRO1 domain-containing protein n=1 Tax=Adineta ricciae TaxID=249248 RepID=A0A814WIH9_ADIRI|nr:unnamed protein product [Adineta ricciae]CAF1202962.1 unnamed protein product [Adineta ricciae]